ncbi:hypothetical protein H072_5309 [Dactylellina haptotyla CBS 200.50]|uniref:Formin GTPase-binding domain-containing protein n=1 Tax=Dactylellina haptotyla (strain CBS 200.50) TaxID=1284197 RepID=S8ACR6_DACHA|nr:hypothetical protein H072_5309 [Dactylellina haptotyla CBS 200.50]
MAPPPSPTKRTSRFFGRHKRSESAIDATISPIDLPQLPPLDFSYNSGAPSSPTKMEAPMGAPLPKPNGKPRHTKTPSLINLLTGKAKKDSKKDTGFTINTDEDCKDDRAVARPATSGAALQPSSNSRVQGLGILEPLDTSFLSIGVDDSTLLDQENLRPSKTRSKANVNKALPPINTKIPADVAREISLYTPKIYTASGQRNFGVTPGLRAPQSRPNSVYGNGERKSSWGSIISLSKRTSMVENTDAPNDNGSFLQRVASIGSGGNKRMHPAALDSAAPSTHNLNHEFNDLLSNFGLPHNIKNGAAEMQPHVKAAFLKAGKVMSKAPLPPPTRNGSPPEPQSFMHSAAPTPREKKKRPLSALGAALFRGDNARARGKTVSTIGLPVAKTGEEKIQRPKTMRSEKAFGGVNRTSTAPVTAALPISPVVKEVTGPLHANAPSDFINYLTGINYDAVDLGWLRRLRRMLRNERLAWVETFFDLEGLDRLVDLVKNIYDLEYHDVKSAPVLREVFLCMKAAYTAPMADSRFDAIHVELFPLILSMMFDEERKKTPYEYETREAAVGLMFTYLQQAPLDQQATRARSVMKILENPPPQNSKLDWVEAITQPRPFTRWSGEVARLTYETGWVWYHPGNRIMVRDMNDQEPYNVAYFPTPRAFLALDGGSVNSIEMNVANYAALHLEIMNAIIAYLPTRKERCQFRETVQISGMEKTMGQILRCAGKGQHYEHLATLHSSLSDWVTAAKADDWASWEHVRTGRFPEEKKDKVKAMRKIEAMYGPQYELPDVGIQDTLAQQKRTSMKPRETGEVFQVNEILEWEF